MASKWTDELMESEIKKCISALQIDRMPTTDEFKALGRNDLHNKISRTKKYSGWAEHLGLKMKHCETRMGNKYEGLVMKRIEEISNHLTVERMSTKHPYDLLVNGCVKIDVKVGKAHNHFEARAHTFALNKKYATCDIYICVALDENEAIEKTFIIPAANAKLVTLNIGKESKYNKYKDKWDFIFSFVSMYEIAIS